MDRLNKLQRQILIVITKSYFSISSEALSAIPNIPPLELDIKLRNDIWAPSRGLTTSAVVQKHLRQRLVVNKDAEIQTRKYYEQIQNITRR